MYERPPSPQHRVKAVTPRSIIIIIIIIIVEKNLVVGWGFKLPKSITWISILTDFLPNND